MNLVHKFLDRTEFSSYEDFKKNCIYKVPENFNFGYDIVDEYARLDPGKPALVWLNDSGEEREFTFSDVKRESDKIANVLRSFGLSKGDRIMLILKQRPEVWFTLVAAAKLGVVAIPASFQLTKKDITYRCEVAGVKYILFAEDEDIIAHIREARDECPTLLGIGMVGDGVTLRYGDEFTDMRALTAAASEEFIRPTGDAATKNDDIMLMYFSSGTTGMPKMIVHDFTYPIGHITTALFWQKVEDCGRHLTVSDSGWAKFAWGKIYGQWICGAVNVAYDTDKFVPEKLLAAINHLKLTTFCAPPTIYRFLIKEDMSVCDFSTIHHCGTAGEPLNPEVVNRFKEATGHTIYEGFGQTESTVLLANFGFDEIKMGSTGKPSPIYDIDIVDENGRSCEDGVVGSIVVKNAGEHPVGLFREYHCDEAAMAHAWKDGVYNTGDMAWRDADGYFWFEGRNDDVIKCSGYRIGPFEVESALMTHPSVLECAVTAVPDPVRGQVVKATIVLARGYEASDELKKELQTHVKVTTAPYKYPRVIEFVKELPKTTSGKIRRVEIRNNDGLKK
ncbi:MAG: AMP-binding protein [Clostridia bacterium]|nr:AMP-binding protein [Clostridia bacterium]